MNGTREQQSLEPFLVKSVHIGVKNSESDMAELIRAAEDFCLERGVDRDTCYFVELALEELLTNTINYGYQPDTEGNISVDLSIDQGVLMVAIVDDGAPYDPLSRPPVDIAESVDDRPVGGLGVHLVKATMDDCRYARENGCNRFTFSKRLDKAA
ncbi:MAG: anti-sigma regulatory factor [Rhodospirillaceae bacterium]|nr:anti-sigma regulatory factor [Rhodospirillaceae bacterium]